ncbi:MAG TPA: M24 family metallopeptidase [Anaerolineaceae bacterium]|nr:M24 family metallopeptidase [Anaerolineaceae bacterium]
MIDRLEKLMENAGASALWITGPAQHNPSMVYFTGICHLSVADLFLIKGKEPVIICGPMEREEAAKSGNKLLSYSDYDLRPLLKETAGDRAKANALRYLQIFKDIGLEEGKVLVYGQKEVGPMVSLTQDLHELNPKLQFKGDNQDAVLLEARALKRPDEIERIRRMGEITTRVVRNTQQLLASSKLDGENLIKADGSPLKLGEVKAQIDLWLAEYGAEAPENTIFSLGRDAALPHSIGNPDDIMCLGKTIVFDIFPCEKGGGYFYDFTRTWSLGYATEEVQTAFNEVKRVYDTLVSELEFGRNPNYLQQRTCDLFEAMGHETIRKNPRIESGYVHGIGHGVGLDVHEKPWSSYPDDPSNNLQAGSVFTIEPGLYYPEKGYGIRLEDTWYCDANGAFHKFADYPMDLVVPMKG